MNRPVRPVPASWSLRLGSRAAAQPSRVRPEAPVAARPGIAARWKPRDRVSAAGN